MFSKRKALTWSALAGVLLALALGATVATWRPSPAAAQMGPMGGQPLDQLSGDDFDRAFLQQMIMHHAMAVMMTQPVVANAAHQEAKDLGGAIIADQTREIGQMRAWLQEWYGVSVPDPVQMMGQGPQGGPMGGPQSGPMGGMPHGGPMGSGPQAGPMAGQPGGMDGMSMMADLWKLPPNRLEAVFFSLMIPHHQGAIDMAHLAPERANHQELKDLAANIVQSQTSENEQMNAWLAAWYGL